MTKPRGPAAKEGTPSERTASETTALLMELGRAVKARSFYAATEPEVRLLFSRAWRSVQADLRRFGALEIEAAPAWLRVPGLALRVPNVQLGGLAQRMTERGVRTLRFETELGSEGFGVLVDLLAGEPEDVPASFSDALYARAPRGLTVNGTPSPSAAAPIAEPPPAALPEAPRMPEAPEQEEPAALDELAAQEDLFGHAGGELAEEAGETEPMAVEVPPTVPLTLANESGEGDWSLSTGETASEAPPAEPTELDASRFGEAGSDATPSTDPDAELALDPGVDPSDATPRTTAEDTDTEAVPAERAIVDEEADYETNDGRPSEVESLMRELGDCDDDFQYHDLARRTEILATALADEGQSDLSYRAMVLFARHAGDDGKRTPLQRDAAMDHLQRLASGMRLAELVDRACASDTESSLEATQVLLRLGSGVVPMLFRAVEREADPNRRGQINGILIAMGESALPELLRALESGESVSIRAAARLAGELQNPKAVAPLAALLEGPEAALRQEAAKALVRIGDGRAIDVLVRSLESPVADVPHLAAFCLGAAANARAAEALLTALRRAVGRRRYEFATELVRSLGRLGRPEAAPDLAALLGHRGLRYRAQWRDLKLAAIAALGRMAGEPAKAALTEAARKGDAPLRRAAQTALDRRGRS